MRGEPLRPVVCSRCFVYPSHPHNIHLLDLEIICEDDTDRFSSCLLLMQFAFISVYISIKFSYVARGYIYHTINNNLDVILIVVCSVLLTRVHRLILVLLVFVSFVFTPRIICISLLWLI